jgi:hypothetical protein
MFFASEDRGRISSADRYKLVFFKSVVCGLITAQRNLQTDNSYTLALWPKWIYGYFVLRLADAQRKVPDELSPFHATTCETETFLLPTEIRHPDTGFEVVRTTRGRDISR